MNHSKYIVALTSLSVLLLGWIVFSLILTSEIKGLKSQLENARSLDEKSTAVIEHANELFACINANDEACYAKNITSNTGLGADWRIARDKFRDLSGTQVSECQYPTRALIDGNCDNSDPAVPGCDKTGICDDSAN